MKPITQIVHAKTSAAKTPVCPTCTQPIAMGCGCLVRGKGRTIPTATKNSTKY